jgi:hypothetical protein
MRRQCAGTIDCWWRASIGRSIDQQAQIRNEISPLGGRQHKAWGDSPRIGKPYNGASPLKRAIA